MIEEIARSCGTSSLIPAVNKLGTVPLLLGADEELKQHYLPLVAPGEGMFSCALSEPEAGSDAGATRTRADRTASGYRLNGVKRWITNAGVSKFYTVMAVTEPDPGASGITAFVVEDGDPGFTFEGAPAVRPSGSGLPGPAVHGSTRAPTRSSGWCWPGSCSGGDPPRGSPPGAGPREAEPPSV